MRVPTVGHSEDAQCRPQTWAATTSTIGGGCGKLEGRGGECFGARGIKRIFSASDGT